MARIAFTTLAAAVIVGISGCASEPCCKHDQSAQKPCDDGRQHARYAIPTGHEGSSVLVLEKDLPGKIIGGQEFTYEIRVTNVAHATLESVVIHDECAAPVTIIRSDPPPMVGPGPLAWNLGALADGETRAIRVVGKVVGQQSFTSCAGATYATPVCLSAPVISPVLNITLSVPTDATPCDAIPARISVTNTGNGAASDVRLFYSLPQGWTTADGKTTAELIVGALDPNQSRDLTVNVTAPRTGEFISKASATGNPGLRVEAVPVKTTVRQAVLTLKAKGPEHIHAGTAGLIELTAINSGTGPATNGIVEAPLPRSVKFISATEGGVLNSGGVVTWTINTLAPKDSKVLAMKLEPTELGALETVATFKAYCAKPARDGVTVSIIGMAGLLLQVADLADPVEVGSDVTYEITVTNQGTAPATNIKINGALDTAQKLVNALGANVTVTGSSIAFEPIATLAPKASVTLKVTAKCIAETDARFRVTMTADQLARPVEESESTHIYK